MPKHRLFPKLLLINGLLVVFLIALTELAVGYWQFQKITRQRSAIWSVIHRGLRKKAQIIDGEIPTRPAFVVPKYTTNPFIQYNEVKGYKLHPLIDYSGVHGIYPKDIRWDYFGFRNERDYYFDQYSGSLIVMTGGSEVAGYAHHQTIAVRLEMRLETLTGKPYRVLNLGMNSYTLSNEINSFVNLAYRLRPKVVVAHSAYNDLFHGRYMPEPFKELGLVYLKEIESWLPRLYDLHDTGAVQLLFTDAGNDSLPKKYLEIRNKYRSLARAGGAQFIGGIQPLNPSKSKLPGYEKLQILASRDDFNVSFEGLKSDDFHDDVHTNDFGAQQIADQYANEILRHVGSPTKRGVRH